MGRSSTGTWPPPSPLPKKQRKPSKTALDTSAATAILQTPCLAGGGVIHDRADRCGSGLLGGPANPTRRQPRTDHPARRAAPPGAAAPAHSRAAVLRAVGAAGGPALPPSRHEQGRQAVGEGVGSGPEPGAVVADERRRHDDRPGPRAAVRRGGARQ